MQTHYKILLTALLFIQAVTVGCKETQVITTPGLQVFATGLTTPVCLAHAGDSRLFAVNQHGTIQLIDASGAVNPVPFLDISTRVTFGGERGLLGLAFHPQYKTNGYFYVNYVGAGDSTHISRFTVSASNPDAADRASEMKLFTLYQPYTNHNGGDLCFGPDGYLYIGLGDGGSAGDPGNRAQNRMLLLGKMLRIDVDHGKPYSIPLTNPYNGSLSIANEIWAYGLRNPWRFSFDRLTHDLWIADVGQNAFEEIDFQPASDTGGVNYGWRCYEGNAPYDLSACGSSNLYTFPVYAYPHTSGCAVVGGFVSRYDELSSLYGKYFFADYCSDSIWTIHSLSDGSRVVESFGHYPGNNFSTFGEDSAGRLYVAGLTNGTIYRIVNDISALPSTNYAPVVKIINSGAGKIRVENSLSDGAEMQLILFDSLGKNHLNSTTRATGFEFDTGSLSRGIYFLSVVLDGRHEVHKILIN